MKTTESQIREQKGTYPLKKATNKQNKTTTKKDFLDHCTKVTKKSGIILAFSEPDEVDSKLIAMETDMLHADWLQELPEDLDMCIAQRDFEGAVDLVERGIHLVGWLLYPHFEKVGGILVYISPWFRPSFRPSFRNSVTLFRQIYLHNRLR